MARIRTIKPSFWAAVSPLSHEARLFAVGLISLADDKGRFIATHAAMAGYIYPHEEIPVPRLRRWLAEVTSLRGKDGTPMVELYSVNGLQYGWFPKYLDHQRINRPQPSPLPPPPERSLCHSVNGSVNGSHTNSLGEWKGMEGNGREGRNE